MIYEFLADGFEEIEALAVVDILRRAELEVKTVSIMDSAVVMGTHGIAVTADILFKDTDFSDAELLILPGGLPGATNLADHEGLKELLLKQNRQGRRIAAICASPAMVFAKHRLIEGKQATCYPGIEDKLVGAGAQPAAALVVTDGNVTTSKGPATAIEFGLELAGLIAGKEKADAVREDLLYNLVKTSE